MADDKIRYVLDVDDKGTPKLVKFGAAAEKSSKQATKGFGDAGKALGEVGNRIPGVGAAMDVMSKGPLIGASVAVAGLAVGFGAMVAKSIDMADSMNDLSLRLGISTERLSVLSLYAEQSGTDIDTLASAMGKLGVKVASGDKDLKSYGVTAGTADEALFQLADKIAATSDPMMRLKIATDAFGKSGQQMLPMLVQGGAALREMGTNAPIVSTEMAKMADEFNDKMAEFKGQFVGIGLSITENVLPHLIAWAEGVDRIRQAMGMLTAEEARAEGRAAIIKKYGDAMTGSRTRSVDGITRIGGKTLRQSLSDYDVETAVAAAPVAAAKTYASSEDIAAKEKAAKAWADKQKKIEEDRVADAFRLNDLEIKTKWDAQVEYEKNSLAAEEARGAAALALNEKELAAKKQAQDRYESEHDAKQKASMDAQFARQMQFAGQMESVMSNAFYNTLRNGDNLWDGLAEGFGNMLAQMAAQMAARAAIFTLFNALTGGSFGLAAGGLSSFVFRAGGGPYESGSNLVTNERRPEAIIPRGPGRVAPTAQGGDTITIVVQNPTQAVSVRRQLTKDDRRRNTGLR